MNETLSPLDALRPQLQPRPPPESTFLPGGAIARRAGLAGAYAVLTVMLVRIVGQDIVEVQDALVGLGEVFPETLQRGGLDASDIALLAIGALAFMLAGGSFLVSRESAGAFALLAFGTVGWFLFPYSEVPWTTVVTGGDQLSFEPPASAWVLGGVIVALATAEVAFSARDTVVKAYSHRGLPADEVRAASRATRAASGRLILAALVVGAAVAIAYALVKDRISSGLIADPDLLWVPALLGLAAGAAIWLAARSR